VQPRNINAVKRGFKKVDFFIFTREFSLGRNITTFKTLKIVIFLPFKNFSHFFNISHFNSLMYNEKCFNICKYLIPYADIIQFVLKVIR
jgi:hypothetical protein